MNESPRDPQNPNTNDRVTHTSTVHKSGTPATGFIIGGLVVAVAIIAFFMFGDAGTQDTATVNMPPAVENNITTAPAPENSQATTPPADTGSSSGEATSGAASNTPPAESGTTTN
jgi:hypothetical protein